MAAPLTELLLISAAETPNVEIIFVHGLDGSARGTWNFGAGSFWYSWIWRATPSWHSWIQSKYPTARIWSLGYRVRSTWWRGGSMAIQDRAINVLATIEGDLPGHAPIIFICHSYGGLLVKQMLFAGLVRAQNEYNSVASRMKGIAFLGTPHNGSRIADYVDALKLVLGSSKAVSELKLNAAHLRDLGGWFRNYAKVLDWKIRVFFETIDTNGVRVVDEDSADPHILNVTPIGIDADHFNISKPPRPDVRLSQTNALIAEVLGTAQSRHPARADAGAAANLLPFLRRYARALTGNQQVGDSFVGAALGVLAQQAESLSKEHARVVLHTILTRLWTALSREIRSSDLPDTPKLARLTPLARQAFLLTSMEYFREEEVAEILSVDVQRARDLVAQAGRDLADGKSVKILIIEDETFLAMDLEIIVEGLGHTVTGVARTHAEAVQLWHKTRPDLILTDIQLADGSSGLDAVNELCAEVIVPVICITAYPERYLTGLRPEPTFLMPKPYQPAAVAALISQVLFLSDAAPAVQSS